MTGLTGRAHELRTWWDDPATGERHSVHARLVYAGAAQGPALEIVRVEDAQGQDVMPALFGTFASLTIRDLVEGLAEMAREGGVL